MFFYHNNAYFIPPDPSGAWNDDPSGASYYVSSPNTICLLGPSDIYMELDKYNSYDELMPYSERTSNMYNNDYNGRVDSAFAKIPITTVPHGETWESRNGLLQNFTVLTTPAFIDFKDIFTQVFN